ncbi:recombinase family protein [Agromyces arachidis]|uniref:recombinase family protein n=1 Tax=Agromyces arachidis TaxID=766966 RepID=UPI004056937D
MSARLPAAIYSRISDDREGREVGVERQEEDCRALAERHGYEVVAVYRENDVSASTRSKKPRPRYLEMLTAARSGECRAILAYSNSRLTRRPLEVEDIITLHERYGTRIETVVSGNDDLSTADGRMVARIKGNVDAAEAERTAERVARAKAQAAAQGRYRGGRRPFGYEKDGVTVREIEAKVIREATDAILVGRSLRATARALNEAGRKTSTGKPWTGEQLRDVLLRPRNAGLLARGQARKAGFEIVGPAEWPAIVEEEKWRALYALLTDSSRRTSPGNDAQWLGSYIYRCGICGAPLRPTATGQTNARPNHTRTAHYRCTAQAHLMITAGFTDDYVRGVVAEMVRDSRVVAAIHPADPELELFRDRRRTLSIRLESFERDYALGTITGAQLQRATATVSAELAEVDARLARSMQRSTSSPILGADDPGQAFLDAPLDVQRAVLATVLRVEVLPRPEGMRGKAWTAERLRLTPAGEG